MSACISSHGEYSDHQPGDWCDWCGAFNEEAITAERDRLRSAVAAVLDIHKPHECGSVLDFNRGCFITFGGNCSTVGRCAECVAMSPCPTVVAIESARDTDV